MHFRSVFLFIVTFMSHFLSPTEGLRTSVAWVRSMAWEDFKEGLQLTGSNIDKCKVISPSQCALRCTETSLCRSFNFCFPNVCGLSSEDVFSIGRNLSLLQESPSCLYYGMTQNYQPFCNEAGTEKDVQDDENIGYCRVNKKRVDRHCSSWQSEVEIDSQEEYKAVEARQIIIDSAHGGLKGSNETHRTLYWLKFIPDTMGWFDAKDICEIRRQIIFRFKRNV